MLEQVHEVLSQPVDSAPLAIFRALFALILFAKGGVMYGELHKHYVTDELRYCYEGLPFLRPLGSFGTHILLSLWVLGSFLMMIGLAHPWGGIAFCVGYGYLFFCDAGMFRNHYYLIFLIGFLLTTTDSSATFSLDAWIRGQRATIPNWHLVLVKMQFFILFFYGGLNKLHGGWLIQHQPLKTWFRYFKPRTRWNGYLSRYCINKRLARKVKRILRMSWAPGLWSWGGLIIDLTVIPLLWFPPTRPAGLVMFIFFNLWNQWFFYIGTFPYLNYAALFLFLDPSTSRALIEWLGGRL